MSEVWKKRFPDEITCVRCLEVKPKEDLDRLLWCDECKVRARHRATRHGWVAGLALALLLALWIVIVVDPSPNLIIGGWIATVVAAFWIGSKVAREVAYGIDRYRNRKAMEAVPPDDVPDPPPSGPD